MKLKQGITIQQVAGKYVGIPIGEECLDFKGILQLNETGYQVWQGLEKGLTPDEIAQKFVSDYDDLSIEDAKNAVQNTIDVLIKNGLVIED